MADLDISLLDEETIQRLTDQQVVGRPLTSLTDLDIDKLMGAVYKWVGETNVEIAAIGGGGSKGYIQLRHIEAPGVNGGLSVSNAWTTRKLNTKSFDEEENCSLSENQFTLAAGTYDIDASSFFYLTGNTKIRLRNITDSVTTIVGNSELFPTAESISTGAISILRGRFTISSTKTFELQYFSSFRSENDDGLGFPVGDGEEVEVYANVILYKIA